jgi:hypothetical protein
MASSGSGSFANLGWPRPWITRTSSPIFESREADGQLYIAMRYVPGMDLKTLIQRDGALGLERSIWILT